MKHKQLKFEKLTIPDLLDAALVLPTAGSLAISLNNLVYLNVDDNYIHQLYPFLKIFHDEIEKPDYFGPDLIGAHISVIYPEENPIYNNNDDDVGQVHHFQVTGLYTAKLGLKKYYVLGIEAPSLLLFRRQRGLCEKLHFKDHSIGFHITLGVWPVDPF